MPNKTKPLPKPRKPKAFSDRLMEAAARVDELPHEELAKLLMKAAIRLRVIQQTGVTLEHIPVYAYHLLRRISHGPVDTTTLFGREDEEAVAFLLSRDLIVRSEKNDLLEITRAGEELGEIADERSYRAVHEPDR
jgi:hypothetical protein